MASAQTIDVKHIENICRCCLQLQDDENLTTFWCKLEIKDFPTILQVFHYSTAVRQTKQAIDLAKICDSCLQELNVAYTFKKKCVANDSVFKKLVEEYHTVEIDDNEIEKTTIESFDILENNSDSDMFVKEEEKIIDENSMVSETIVEEIHLENEDVDLEVQVNSDNAEESSMLSEYLENDAVKTEEFTDGYLCSFCSKTFSSKGQVQSHERRIHIRKENMMYSCEDCKETFTSRVSLKEHSKTHSPKIVHNCDMCEKVFYSRYSLKNHRNHFHDLVPKQHQCEICLKYFKQKCALSKHYKIHADVRPFECSFLGCDKKFRLKHHVEQHIRTHTGERPYHCEICNASFSQSETLNQHIKGHISKAEGIEYKCSYCNKNFSRLKILNEHVKTHTDPHRHLCPYCPNKYHHKADLRTHLFSKHLNMSFNCMLCNAELKLNERFHRTYSLHFESMHNDLPEEELKEYLYKIKKMRIFDVSDDLPDVLKDKGKRNNECKICNINFSTALDLTNHKTNFHNDQDQDVADEDEKQEEN